ncbi:MAG: Tol-Pal system beta propeller repeat protein TolB [Alphaproteobacteria bacterium]
MNAPLRLNWLLPTLVVIWCVAAFARPVAAQIVIDITNPTIQPLPLAVTTFHGVEPSEQEVGQNLASVISADLERSGLFRAIDPAAYIQDPASLQNGPTYSEWRIISADALVGGSVITQADGRLRVEFRLWDVIAERQVTGLAYFTAPNNWRRVGHIIADAIFKEITGEEGFFDTRVVYVSETGPLDHRVKRLAIMDQDGENHSFLTDGSTLVLTPRFSPTAQEITYLAYYNDQPRVYLYNIESGRREVLGDFPGMTFAPRFTPDGNQVVMSLATDGNSDIYTMDLRTRQLRRLTYDTGIDTSASFSPDGIQLAFESDRGGSQQLYVMRADGSGVQRISFGEGRYGGPVWSPRGDLIAFTKILAGRFYIGVMRPDGSNEKLLAEAFHVEGPTWAPNGRVLMYFSETPSGADGTARIARLQAVDLTGTHNWAVPTPLGGSDPAWSPLIP